jgi:hypothetical protein
MLAGLRSKGWFITLTFTVLVCASVGCGGGDDYAPPEGVILRGKVYNGGGPMRMERPDVGLGSIELVLVPDGVDPSDENVDLEATIAAVDGSFNFEGPGKGIPSGNYRLAVYHYESGPDVDNLEGAFSTVNSPIEITVKEEHVGGEQDLGVIDVKEFASKVKAAAPSEETPTDTSS